ncbi:MAG: competence/damage-inducible protein A [bacterium]|nr:competence/damage-inducible protein A [bacterium]
MKATVIAIGDEILAGKIVNNNAAFISGDLNKLGIRTVRQLVVGDESAAIAEALDIARRAGTLAVCSGGLGPTADDVTLEAVAGYFGKEPVLHRPTLENIETMFRRRRTEMPQANISQAMVPAGCRVLENQLGTAPGIIVEDEGFVVCLVPGVPAEMERIIERGLVPYLEKRGYSSGKRFERLLRVVGLAESRISDLIGEVDIPPGLSLGYYPQVFEVLLLISGYYETEGGFEGLVSPFAERLYEILDYRIYGEGPQPLQYHLGELLRKRGLTLATAESCTGGLVAKWLTDIPGSSDYFAGGVVAYFNAVKTEQLEVPAEILEEYGAVSEQVAAAMARGVRERLNTDVGLSVTGIAGPGGGSDEKPTGTVCFGLAYEGGEYSEKRHIPGDRDFVRKRAAQRALDMVRLHFLGRLKEKVK